MRPSTPAITGLAICLICTLVIPASALVIGSFQAAITIRVNVSPGAVVGDILSVKADVVSAAGVSKVEFSIDDQLKQTTTQPPFEFKWDTVDENEGEHTLIVAAYDAQGNAVAKRVRVEVDNGLSLGIKPHAEKALAYLRAGELEKAHLEGRKAHKINMADPEAVRALAAGVGGKGDYNRAIDLLEKPQMQNNQVIGDPKIYPMTDPVAMELRSRFRIQRAEKQSAIPAMMADLATAYDFWRKLYAIYLTDVRRQYPDSDGTPRARVAVGDALFHHGEYEAAIAEYQKVGVGVREHLGALNRIGLALIRLGRYREAEQLTRGLIDRKEGNDGTQAVLAILLINQRSYSRAREEVAAAAAKGSLAGLVAAAHADIGMGNARRAYEAMTAAARRAAETPDLQYLAAGYFTEASDLKTASTALFAALRMDPGLLDTYAMRGLQLAALQPKDGFAHAQAYFDFVLERDPRHVTARIGRAITLIHEKKYRQAEAILKPLTREERGSGDVWVALAAAHEGMNDRLSATEDLKMAQRADPERFKDTAIPGMAAFVLRVGRYRRPPLLTPHLLGLDETGGTALSKAAPEAGPTAGKP